MKHSTNVESNGKYGSHKVDSNDKSDSEILVEEELSSLKVDTGENTDRAAAEEAKVAQSTASVPTKKKNKILFLLIGSIALIGGAIFGWRWWQFNRIHVTTDNAQIEGHISPIAPKVSATVQQVLVQEGDRVQAGQALVILEDRDLNLKVQQAEANLQAAQAQLNSAAHTVPLAENTNTSDIQQAQSNLAAQQAGIVAAQTNVQQARSTMAAARSQLQQALATVAANQAKVQKAESGVLAARAKVAQAQTELTKNQRDFQRYQTLYEQGAISAQQRDVAQAAFQTDRANLVMANEGVKEAEAEVNDARSQLQQTQAAVNSSQAQIQSAQAAVDNAQAQVQKSQAEAEAAKAQIAGTKAATQKVVVQQDQTQVANAQVKQAEANLALARQQLAYTTIYAPVSGSIGQLTAEVGQKVQPGQPLLAVVPLQADQIYVQANFKETALKNLQVGEIAEVEADAYPGQVFPAKIAGISPATGAQFALLPPDNATGNFNKVVQWVPVRLTFLPNSDPEHKLRAGLSVRVTVNTENGQKK